VGPNSRFVFGFVTVLLVQRGVPASTSHITLLYPQQGLGQADLSNPLPWQSLSAVYGTPTMSMKRKPSCGVNATHRNTRLFETHSIIIFCHLVQHPSSHSDQPPDQTQCAITKGQTSIVRKSASTHARLRHSSNIIHCKPTIYSSKTNTHRTQRQQHKTIASFKIYDHILTSPGSILACTACPHQKQKRDHHPYAHPGPPRDHTSHQTQVPHTAPT